MLEYGFRQAIRDSVLGLVGEQKHVFDSVAALLTRALAPLVEEEVRRQFLVRLAVIEPTALERVQNAIQELRRELNEKGKVFFAGEDGKAVFDQLEKQCRTALDEINRQRGPVPPTGAAGETRPGGD